MQQIDAAKLFTKKRLRRKRLNFEDALRQAQKEDVAFFSDCTKFKAEHGQTDSLQRAMEFLCLKANQIDKKEALKFVQRRVCKIDSTKILDGPSTARVLKTSSKKQGTLQGWCNGSTRQQFELGAKFRSDIVTMKHETEDDKAYEQFLQNDENQVQETQKVIERIQQDQKDTHLRCQFTGLKSLQLMEKLQKFKEQNRQLSERQIEYVEMRGQRFYYILGDIKDYLDKKPEHKSILDEMRTFSPLTTLQQRLKVYTMEAGDPIVEKPQRAETVRRKERLHTDINYQYRQSSEEFNQLRYVYGIKEIPSHDQRKRQTIFQNLLDHMKENSLKTPRSPLSQDSLKSDHVSEQPSPMVCRGLYEPDKKKLVKKGTQYSTQMTDATASESRNQRYRLASRKTNSVKIDNGSLSPSRLRKEHSVLNHSVLFGSRSQLFENKVNQIIQNHIEAHNKIQNAQVDTTLLKLKYQSLMKARQKQMGRMYKASSGAGILLKAGLQEGAL